MSQDAGDRTYDPTDARKEEFRKQGRFAKARDAAGVVATAAVIVVLAGTEERCASLARTLYESTLGDLGALERLGPAAVLGSAALSLAALSGAAIGAAVLASIAVSVALQVAVVHVPFLNVAFGTVPLAPGQWLACAALGSAVLWTAELRKALVRLRG